jgi:hypothetical protein
MGTSRKLHVRLGHTSFTTRRKIVKTTFNEMRDRLIELEEVLVNDEGITCWAESGEPVGPYGTDDGVDMLRDLSDAADRFMAEPPERVADGVPYHQYTTAGDCRVLSEAMRLTYEFLEELE